VNPKKPILKKCEHFKVPAMRPSIPIITIDGPGGVGKGTMTRLIAKALHFNFLDSGALYRVTAFACQKHSIPIEDIQKIVEIATHLDLRFQLQKDPYAEPDLVFEGEKVNELIRLETCGTLASKISAYPEVRKALIELQHSFAKVPGLVTDGRDMGTVVFPQAQVKFFLTATSTIRAQRRHKQLQDQGIHASIDHLLAEIEARDLRDQTRSVSPLVSAKDALIIDTSALSIDEVVSLMMQHIEKMGIKRVTRV
jgi:CMP/dCMP kinase